MTTRMSKAQLTTRLTLNVCPRLKPAAQRVLLLLLGYAAPRGDGWVAWPSQDELAQRGAMSRRTVLRGLADLVAAGVVRSERTQTQNRYWIEADSEVSTVTNLSHPECHPCHIQSDTGVTSGVTKTTGPIRQNKSNEQEQQQRAAAAEKLSECQEAIAEELATLPGNLRVDRRVAEQLARSPGMSRGLIQHAVREVRAKHNVRHPAGMLVSMLREPDLGRAYDEAERRRSESQQRAEAKQEAQAKADAEAARLEQERREALESAWHALTESERAEAIQAAMANLSPIVRRHLARDGTPLEQTELVITDAMELALAGRGVA